MFDKNTSELLESKMKSVPAMALAASLRFDVDELVADVLARCTLAVIDDAHTSTAYGDHVTAALQSRYAPVHLSLPPFPKADSETVEHILEHTARCDALVAVGSGTINDLCKYAAAKAGKPYIVFPTAASMNGYASANASITVDGHKTTLPAHMPLAIFCDLSVIAASPSRLNRSGLGDSVARPTAQADWLLSHLLLGTAYDTTPFDLLKGVEAELFDNARGVALADEATAEMLMKALLLSGLGMTLAGGSYPASQGEHMIAHAYGMLKAAQMPPGLPPLHGEEIGITSLYMARRQQRLLRSTPALKNRIFDAPALAALYGETLTAEFKKAYWKKLEMLEAAPAEMLLEEQWEGLAEQLERVMLSAEHMEAILTQAGCFTHAEALGWRESDLTHAAATARFTRERFTFLDIA